MDIDGSKLLSAAGSAVDLAKFIIGDGLRESMAAITGDVHLKAAQLALRTAEISNSPEDRIKSAITHLEAAHVAYKQIEGRVSTFRGRRFQETQIVVAARKDVWVSCLMALCYTFLGDYGPAKQALGFAKQANDLDDKIMADESDMATLFLFIGPLSLLVNRAELAACDEEVPVFNAEELRELRSRLTALSTRDETQQEIRDFLKR